MTDEIDETQNPGLIASGGWRVPYDLLYDIELASTKMFPELQVEQGGLSFTDARLPSFKRYREPAPEFRTVGFVWSVWVSYDSYTPAHLSGLYTSKKKARKRRNWLHQEDGAVAYIKKTKIQG